MISLDFVEYVKVAIRMGRYELLYKLLNWYF